tara:strand:- start:6121 stop:7332 length:1212 start_codon:yes stop_codon:yes gene_type:complete
MTDTNILVGDCRQILETLPEQSVQCVVTSPPYWGQRDYGVDGMIGLEADVHTWLTVMVDVFRGVRRVLRDDGTVWLNLGDKYAGSGGAGGDYNAGGLKAEQSGTGPSASTKQSGFKQKDLMGLPWRVALALQDDGWYLRRDIIWHKPNPMPESATDRPATAHEYVFLLTKQPRYFYDADAVRTITGKEASPENYGGKGLITHPTGPERKAVDLGSGMSQTKVMPNTTHPAGASLRSVWKIATQAFGGAHYATYPEKLVEPCIQAGTSEAGECPECGAPWKRVVDISYGKSPVHGRGSVVGRHEISGQNNFDGKGYPRIAKLTETLGWQPTCDHKLEPIPQTVLDPFSGAGTTGLVAARFDRNYIGIELNPEYAAMSRKRIADRVGVTDPEQLEDNEQAQGQLF